MRLVGVTMIPGLSWRASADEQVAQEEGIGWGAGQTVIVEVGVPVLSPERLHPRLQLLCGVVVREISAETMKPGVDQGCGIGENAWHVLGAHPYQCCPMTPQHVVDRR